MHYGNIKDCDIANGLGVRVSLFVSGCTHHCKGCFQPQTWNFKYGDVYTQETEDQIVKMLEPSYINGLSLLGGEPMEPDNQRELVKLCRRVKKLYPEKNIWCYTGYTYETDLRAPSRARCEVTDELLSYIDVHVDGEYVEAKKNIVIAFRGSTNQRLIDMNKTRETGHAEILPDLP